MSFHPFQGRPLFGHSLQERDGVSLGPVFPSLSGKTSIRTGNIDHFVAGSIAYVSIPFREDLYSDVTTSIHLCIKLNTCFHPFQGRPLFGPQSTRADFRVRILRVSIPFREDLYSDQGLRGLRRLHEKNGFHPFQGRPLFGLEVYKIRVHIFRLTFPSLSGKTSIRTSLKRSSKSRKICTSFHPFQGRPLFGQDNKVLELLLTGGGFPSLSGKTSIRTEPPKPERRRSKPQVSIPFREDLYSDKD